METTKISTDPRQLIADAPMSSTQVMVVTITIILCALDGFDVLAISFASPGIANEWGIDKAALGIVLSMELIGMSIGSIMLGGIADKIGRRITILGCLTIMSLGMFMVTRVSGIIELSVWRVITGLGIGGILAAINAVAAEFSNTRRKHLCVSLMAIGYPFGVVVGGTIAAQLLKSYDWRSVFYLGTAMTVMCIPLVYFLVPESIHWLTSRQPDGALSKINATLKRMGHATLSALPEINLETQKSRVADIFSPTLIVTTLLITAAYFSHIMTFYFILKWTPKLVVDMGFQPSAAAGVLVWATMGGVIGGVLFSLLTIRFPLKPLTIVACLLSTIMIAAFGRSPADLDKLAIMAASAGFFSNAAIVGLYAIIAHVFPTHVRAFGTGFVIGIGRGGSMLAPIIAGFMFQAGISLATVAMIISSGSLIAIMALWFLKLKPG